MDFSKASLVRLLDRFKRSTQSKNSFNAYTRFELRSNDPPPNARNTNERDLVFCGEILFQAEREWNDDSICGTRLDGDIYEGIAIYRATAADSAESEYFVAEQLRTNWVVIIVPENPIPFFSQAEKFISIEQAADWLRLGSLAQEGDLREQLDEFMRGTVDGITPVSIANRLW